MVFERGDEAGELRRKIEESDGIINNFRDLIAQKER